MFLNAGQLKQLVMCLLLINNVMKLIHHNRQAIETSSSPLDADARANAAYKRLNPSNMAPAKEWSQARVHDDVAPRRGVQDAYNSRDMPRSTRSGPAATWSQPMEHTYRATTPRLEHSDREPHSARRDSASQHTRYDGRGEPSPRRPDHRAFKQHAPKRDEEESDVMWFDSRRGVYTTKNIPPNAKSSQLRCVRVCCGPSNA